MTSAPVSLNKKDAKAAEDITAPEDFIGADQAVLRHLDHSARCSICYELYASPVLLTGCSHTFCSSVRYLQSSLRSKLAKLTECQKCIRVHLDSNPGKPMCPTCGTATSETALKPNKALEEMTQKWAAARNLVLDLVASANKQKAPSAQSSSRHRKRAAADDGDDKTHKRRKSASASRAASPGGSDLEIVASPRADDPNIDVDCPMCGRTMKNSAVAKHINKCTGDADAGAKSNWAGVMLGGAKRDEGSQTGPKKMNRISAQYAIGEVRDKLKDVKLYDHGSTKDKALSKEALIWRYNQYAIIYNANQDASEQYRRKPSALRKQVLDEEKKIPTPGTSSAPSTKVNLASHARTYEDQFAMLTQQARAGGTAQSVKAAPNATSADAGDIQTTGNGSVGEVRPPQASSARSASPKGPIEIQDSDSGED